MEGADAQPAKTSWWKVAAIGRRPKFTLLRIAVLIAVCVVVFRFVLLPIRVDGISMQPTYHTGQLNCINRLAYLRREPQRGDIVSICLAKPGWLGIPHVMYMKRVIGLPGETVAFTDGHVLINGQPLPEPYVKFGSDWNHRPILCSTNEYYVVGDNRSMPFALHYQGRAERDHIMGKLLL